MHRNMIGEKLTRRRLDRLCSPIDLHPQFQRLESFFACPREVRRMIYATNAIESPALGIAQDHQGRGRIPVRRGCDESCLALRNIGIRRKPAIEWRPAYAQSTTFFV
jgi:putative transposase